MGKKFYRCKVCGDIHWGGLAPAVCPTCGAADAYLELPADEAKKEMGA
jgi:rubrerythrin